MLLNFTREDIDIQIALLSNDEMEIAEQSRDISMWIEATERIEEHDLHTKLQL